MRRHGVVGRIAHCLLRGVRQSRPTYAPGPGIFVVGMAIIRHGTEKQRRRHLRAGLRGEAIWAQGLAEPGVGRDLANVRTHAVSAGEEYLVSGTKISPGRAVDADWMYTLVRTSDSDSARNSLSYLLIDLSSPGVTLRQLDDTGSGQPTFEVSSILFECPWTAVWAQSMTAGASYAPACSGPTGTPHRRP